MNRTRAAMITRMLLCDDYLERPIDFGAGTNILEDTELSDSRRSRLYYLSFVLDPLASSMFEFWWIEQF